MHFPRLIYKGDAIDLESAKLLLEEKTINEYKGIYTDNPEGMVWRMERKGKVDFLGKWVRDDFVAGKYLKGIGSDADIYN